MNKFGKAVIFGAAAAGALKLIKTITSDEISREKAYVLKDCVVNTAHDCAGIMLDRDNAEEFVDDNDSFDPAFDDDKKSIKEKLVDMKDSVCSNIKGTKEAFEYLNKIKAEQADKEPKGHCEINIEIKKADPDKDNSEVDELEKALKDLETETKESEDTADDINAGDDLDIDADDADDDLDIDADDADDDLDIDADDAADNIGIDSDTDDIDGQISIEEAELNADVIHPESISSDEFEKIVDSDK